MRRSLFTLSAALLTLGSLTASAQTNGRTVLLETYADRETLADPTEGPCPDMPRSLTQVDDNLYRHTSQALPSLHSGFVLVTDEGALVIDPAGTCSANWLQDEIDSRFGVPVRYVVYTHAHFDHIAGSQVFQDAGATVVAHENAVEPIIGEKLPTAVPNVVFDDSTTITLGGETVELYHIAPSHSNSMTLVYFPQYKALQCTDICQSDTFPYNDFLDFYYGGWIESLDWVLQQDVDVIDIGHYTPATKDDIVDLREYMVDLHGQVLHLVREGQHWDQLYRNVDFKDEYEDWYGYDQMRILNILGMYRWVTNHRRGVW
ncbi:MBL fold metallo-hydrolase [Rubrivirga sp. S365]|uniref:MBL fold metallo-hydrolase n=1 Tax=Rubrivirga sp. S365 TaxID=3076080 RepID=UPI00391F7A96